MKSFQQNLLIVVALSLCGLCVYQWYGQTAQRNEIQSTERMLYAQSALIQGYTNSMHTMDRQIAQMDARITELKNEAKTNADFALSHKRELSRFQATAEGLTNEIAEYKAVVATLEGRLKVAYDGIQKQNEAMNELVAQRDELVKKFNDSVTDRNQIVNKYNDLVRLVEQSRATEAKK
jgi:chromosome segregation ATPase